MEATAEIRRRRIEAEYQSLRDAQDQSLARIDGYEAALLGLTEAVNRNSRDIAEVRQDISELNGKLDAIIKHLQVPYDKPPMGFQKEIRPKPDLPV
ncbi:MAG: hypothetical protein OXE95_14210 [Chloroflexi bacterium]|nr:hypothetical protein [Chloroflexota bacterium]MCY4248721.1 hypothetical protein [Chloroflexota bacterium]